jgi:hypothetical protein
MTALVRRHLTPEQLVGMIDDLVGRRGAGGSGV